MNMEADDVVVDRPVLATALVAAVAAIAYVGIQVVLGDAVAPLETAVFVVVFTTVYVAGNRYLRGRERAEETATDAADAETAEDRTTGE
jgi:membrane protein implicated in regulation of membrane protease activity